jgi:hypothetical protein
MPQKSQIKITVSYNGEFVCSNTGDLVCKLSVAYSKKGIGIAVKADLPGSIQDIADELVEALRGQIAS